MSNRAHGLRLDHRIFHSPLDAAVELTELPADHFMGGPYDDRQTWLVQRGEMGKENDFGVVSDGYGFEDSPDCERISGGINSKGPAAVAIGRQANLLQWGFYAAPDRMTESARRAFLNSLVYMRQFDGTKPLVKKVARSRDSMDQVVASLREYSGRTDKASSVSYYLGRFPVDVVTAVGSDPDALGAWLAEHREYLRSTEDRKLVVDTDLLELGISNRESELIDWLVDALERDSGDARALRLAKQYLGPAGQTAESALTWIYDNRARLFFSDVGGYRWFVDSRVAAASGAIEASGETPDQRGERRDR